MKSEKEIKQKLNEIEEKRVEAKKIDYHFLKSYYDGLIDGLRWVMQGDNE
jgi:hypothetical protein